MPSTSKSVDGAIKLLSIAYTDEYVYNTMLFGLEDRDYVVVDEELGLIDYPEGMDANTVPYCAYMTMGEWGTEAYMWNIFDDQTEKSCKRLLTTLCASTRNLPNLLTTASVSMAASI